MGLDDRGIDRGNCRVEECDCTEFVASDAMSCGYCGDPPAKHQNLQQHVSSSTASSSTQNVTLSSNIGKYKNVPVSLVILHVYTITWNFSISALVSFKMSTKSF